MGTDFWIVFRWWGSLFLVGAVAFPLTKQLFPTWHDRGYLFAKAVGMVIVTYLVYLLSVIHAVPFTQESVYIALIATFCMGVSLHLLHPVGAAGRRLGQHTQSVTGKILQNYTHWTGKVILVLHEEAFFFAALLVWSWVKGHEPSVHGLEKFMDYGFMQSILNSRWFPAPDIWYTGLPINYYYFGHTVVAVLTKLSALDLVYTFNLMLASLFAFTFTMSYSIGLQMFRIGSLKHIHKGMQIFGAILTAFFVTLAGNMQTIYAFTRGYTGEDVKPLWELLWPIAEFRAKLPEGLERYWYANATRFIPFTIHEFPSYSFVVSDVHGHVLSLPFVLLALALLVQMFGGENAHDEQVRKHGRTKAIFGADRFAFVSYIFYGLLVSVLLMTNALDGPIYLGIFVVLFFIDHAAPKWRSWIWWKDKFIGVLPTVAVSGIASIPFLHYFSSFVSGLAINCPPSFLASTKFGPFLFEGVEKCQHSPVWMMWLLWGFFIYTGSYLINLLIRRHKNTSQNNKITRIEIVLIIFFIFSLLLIIFPEFFYFKDIYPAHFRSNTMFKLGYQAFIMFSLIAGYVVIHAITSFRENRKKRNAFFIGVFLVLLIPQIFLVSIYPVFSVRSYFDSLRTYKGLDGLQWLRDQYPDDYAAILWLRNQLVSGSSSDTLGAINTVPVLIEADGDSYTDYARYSAFTGFPSVIGWPVHEWLWRGSYDVVAPRREEVRVVYESDSIADTTDILKKYNVQYIIVSDFERQKFTALNLEKIEQMATRVYVQGVASIYRVNTLP